MHEFKRRLNRRLLAALVLVVAGLLYLETRVAPRLLAPMVEAQQYAPDPLAGFRYRPLPDQGVNAEGFLSPPVPARVPGELRILCLGSSELCAVEIDRQRIFPRLLETSLGQRLGRPVRVINTAVLGYCVYHVRYLLDEVWEEYHPDVLVMGLSLSEASSHYYVPPRPSQEWKNEALRLAYRSRLVQWLMLKARNAPGFGGWPPIVPIGGGLPPKCLAADLESFRLFVQEHQVPFLVTVMPYDAEKNEWEKALTDVTRRSMGGRGNPALWIEDRESWKSLEGKGFNRDKTHLNARGHEVVAAEVEAELARRGWLTINASP